MVALIKKCGLFFLAIFLSMTGIVLSVIPSPTSVKVNYISTSMITVSVRLSPGVYDGIRVELLSDSTAPSSGSFTGEKFTSRLTSVQTKVFTINNLSPQLIPRRSYFVRVQSRSGNDVSDATVVTGTITVPRAPIYVAVNDITTSAITVGVTLPAGDYDGVVVDIVYGVTTSSGSFTGEPFTITDSKKIIFIVDTLARQLIPGRSYSVRVKSRYGNAISDDTAALGTSTVRPALPLFVTVTSISTSEVTVSVTFQQGDYDGVEVYIRSDLWIGSGSSRVQSFNVTNNQKVVQDFTVKVLPTDILSGEQIIPGRSYTVRVVSRSSKLLSNGYTEGAERSTIPPASPTSVTVNSFTTSEVTVSVTLQTGDYDGVVVEILSGSNVSSTGSSLPQRFTVDNGATVKRDFTVNNLSPPLISGRSYTVRVISTSGNSVSESAAVAISLVSPPSPTSVTVSSISTTDITVSVTLPAGDYASILVELWFESTLSSTGSTLQPFTVRETETKEFRVTNLQPYLTPGRNYSVGVKSTSGNATSRQKYAAEMSVVSPAPPTLVTVSSITTSEIKVSVTLQPGDYSGVQIEFWSGAALSSRGHVKQLFTVTQVETSTFTVSNLNPTLTPGRSYYVRVRSTSVVVSLNYATSTITVPPATPTSVTVNSISSRGITVDVTLPTGLYDGVMVKLLYSENVVSQGLYSFPVYFVRLLPEMKSITIAELSPPLTPGRAYIVRVQSRSGTEFSGYLTATTTSYLPGTTTSSLPSDPQENGVDAGLITMGVAIPVGLVCIVVIIVILVRRRRRSKDDTDTMSNDNYATLQHGVQPAQEMSLTETASNRSSYLTPQTQNPGDSICDSSGDDVYDYIRTDSDMNVYH